MGDSQEYPGSRWWKFDFHAHTPKSGDYGRGEEKFKRITPREWLQAAMEKELDAIAITDHNSGEWIDALKQEYESLLGSAQRPDWFRPMVLFPGFEITVAESTKRVHLLGIFDPTRDSGGIHAVLGRCGLTSAFGDETRASNSGLHSVANEIADADGIAIPAHVDGPQGLFEGLQNCPCDLDGMLEGIFAAEFCNLDALDRADGKLKQVVGRMARIGGSDAHIPSAIGRHFTWVRMGRPGIEGLRLALQDADFCIRNQEESPEHLPEMRLVELTIESMKTCGRIAGRPFRILFHPNFNALIGGRGTGKSTILESIRIALRRDRNLPQGSRPAEDLVRFKSMQNGVMLENTEIRLVVHRNGIDFRLRWRMDGQGATLEERDGDGWKDSVSGDIASRFPVSIYSQKEINELAIQTKGLLAIVDRVPEIGWKEWELQWDTARSRFLQLCEREREVGRLLETEPLTRMKLRDIENDLAAYEAKGHAEILKRFQRFSQQRSALPSTAPLVELATRIQTLASQIVLPDFPVHPFDPGDPGTMELEDIHRRAGESLTSISIRLDSIAGEIRKTVHEMERMIHASGWAVAEKTSTNEYAALLAEYREKTTGFDLSRYGEWVRSRAELQQQIRNLETLKQEREALQTQKKVAKNDLLSLRIQLARSRQEYLESTLKTNPYVRMTLIPFGETEGVEEKYRDILGIEPGPFGNSISGTGNNKGALQGFLDWKAQKTKPELLDLVEDIKVRTQSISNGSEVGNHAAFRNRLERIKQNDPAAFDRLEAWWPEDMLQVRYAREAGVERFEALDNGSAGQKAAAILAFLLSHGEDPMILDQPEDDLDNAVVYDLIVKQIQNSRSRRQIIVVTHNPNIVVNGDADLVHELHFEGGQIHLTSSGGLEEKRTREGICTIMEGGSKAFLMRYKRIRPEG